MYCEMGILSWAHGDTFSVSVVEHHFLPLVSSDLFCYFSRGHLLCANTEQIRNFSRVSYVLVQCTKNSFHRGGGVCVCFVKSVRKGLFRNAWASGGGVTVLSTKLYKGRHKGRGNALGITHYHCESESSSLLPLSTRVGTPLGYTSPCL